MPDLQNDHILSIELEDGTEMLCEILFTFESDQYKKHYVLYTPIDNEEGDVFASSYVETEDGLGELEDITDELEWEMIEEVLNTFQSEE
ncbi:DUF1292 domain-containing protein [Mycoplasmatota bacterium zrk1]